MWSRNFAYGLNVGFFLQTTNIWIIISFIFYWCGLLGLSLSILMRLELAGCGDLIIQLIINYIIRSNCTCLIMVFFVIMQDLLEDLEIGLCLYDWCT